MTHEDDQSKMQALATRIRTLYWLHLRNFVIQSTGQDPGVGARRCAQWDGGEDGSGKHYTAIWPEIATYFRENRIDADRAVQEAFQPCPGSAPPPPTVLLGPRLATAAREERMATKARLTQSVNGERSKAEAEIFIYARNTALAAKEIYSRVALNPNGLSPLFRYCFASETQLPGIAAQFRDRALAQYAEHPDEYDEMFAGLIPPDFRAELAERGLLPGHS
jgi:hypothetical protein